MTRTRTALTLMAVLAAGVACSGRSPGFPPPARPGISVSRDAQSVFLGINALLEARGIPVLVADTTFGSLRTDWVEWEPGENSFQGLARCPVTDQSPPSATRARFGFEVRARTVHSFVTIYTQWQMEAHPGFDDTDRGYVNCPSTGEWERRMEENILQRQVVR